MSNSLQPNSSTVLNYTPLSPHKDKAHSNNQPKTPSKFIYMISVLIFTASLSFSFIQFNNQSFSINSKASEQSNLVQIGNILLPQERAIFWKQRLLLSPQNPKVATATATENNKQIEINNYDVNKFSQLTFTWSGEEAKEPGKKIVGYYVYFGPENSEIPFPDKNYNKSVNPQYYGKYIETNSFTTENLTKGVTYYLYITAVSDSKDENLKYGLERVGETKSYPAKKLFTYTYQ